MKAVGKIILIVIALIVVGAIVYGLFFSGGDSAGDERGLQSTTNRTGEGVSTQEQQALSRQFLVTLLNLNSLTLNTAIFSDPAFQALRDYTVILIPEGNEGRVNPFAPIGVDPEPARDDDQESDQQSTQ